MSPGTINIAIVHANDAQREALCDFVADEVGFRIVGGAVSGPAALDLMRDTLVHILVLHLESLPGGAETLITDVRALSPHTGILLLLGGPPHLALDDLMLRGATGYLSAARIATDMTAALRTIGMGRRYRPPLQLESS
jgi:DNA-binding NarL/FixJ family response regulator